MTTSKRIAAAAMVLIVAAHATARGQQDVGLSLDLVAFGGFLGYLDGFVEYSRLAHGMPLGRGRWRRVVSSASSGGCSRRNQWVPGS